MKLRFAEHFLLRFHMLLIVLATLASSLICNRILLDYGFNSMLVRFPLNVTAGYLAFFLFIRLWLHYIRSLCALQLGQVDFSLKESSGRSREPDSWIDRVSVGDPGITDQEGGAVIILLAVFYVFLAGGLILIYEAPIFLSETAASFFLVGSLSRPIREIDTPGWTGSVFIKTWTRYIFSLVLALVMAFCARVLCPKSHTIIEIIRNCS